MFAWFPPSICLFFSLSLSLNFFFASSDKVGDILPNPYFSWSQIKTTI